MNLAIDVYQLTRAELERWDFVYGRKCTFDEMIEDCAVRWRDHLRLVCESEEECRWAFLRESCPQHKTLFPQNSGMKNVPDVARYLSHRTEERVACMDAIEDSRENPT